MISLWSIAVASAAEPVVPEPMSLEVRLGGLLGPTRLPTSSDLAFWWTPSLSVHVHTLRRGRFDLLVGLETAVEFGASFRGGVVVRPRWVPLATVRIPIHERIHLDLSGGYAIEYSEQVRAGGVGSIGLTSMWRGDRFGWWGEGRVGAPYNPGVRWYFVGGTGINAGVLARW